MKNFIITCVGALLFVLNGYAGYYAGRKHADLEVYEMGYNLGFQSAIIPNSIVVADDGKKYRITEIKD